MQKSQISSSRALSNWVLIGVIMLLIQVALGGITRLTGSGLSITEWDVFTGAIPPLHEQQWVIEFNKYKQSPQYQLLNTGFQMADFKFIFFWEWFHRFWARLVGLVFIVGFVYLLLKRKLNTNIIKPLLILFLLGALQGAIGWIMVASGLEGDAIYVKPTRLALHFVFALGLICYAFWFYLSLTIPSNKVSRSSPLRVLTWVILCLLGFQLIYGALMAGYKAASAASTWPTINGDWIPAAIQPHHSFFANLLDNKIMVHFIHRSLAYLLFLFTCIWTFQAYRVSGTSIALRKKRWMPLLLISIQILLGIGTVLLSPGILPNRWVAFDWFAQVHQLCGMLFLLVMIYMMYIVRSYRLRS